MQKLYPLEVSETLPELPQPLNSQVERQGSVQKNEVLCRAEARCSLEDARNDLPVELPVKDYLCFICS